MEHAKHPSATKRGPGRRHAAVRSGKTKKTNFAAALVAHWAAKRAGSKAHKAKHTLRDKHGAVTLTGQPCEFVDCRPDGRWYELGGSSGPEGFAVDARRVWLAGISAQRGY
ncbi:MAG TPA: hypothetical protein P5163_20090 [Rubrivivax sp.]|nr:hypothetical protein [Rubrivivax sp.]HRZ62892.1 hypothetical protein [Rubrivivax sp.]